MSRKTTVRTPVVFDAATRFVEGGHAVYPDAFLFELGRYEDKGFELTEAEADAAIAGFTPVTGNFDHTPLLKGRAFTIHDMRRDPAHPRRLRGKVTVPLGLDELLTDEEKGFSAEWDRVSKRLVGGALTPNPRIKGASLVARFAAAAEKHGGDPELWNETVATLAAFACACGHDVDEAKAETPTETEDPPMTKKEQALAKLEAMDDESVFDAILDETPADDDDHDDEPDVDSATSDFSSEAASLRAEVEELKAERRKERAAAFAKDMKTQNRIAPFEEAATAAVMFAAMSDDADIGDTVNFAVGDKSARGSREQMVRAAYGQRLPHNRTREVIGTSDFSGHALDNGGTKPETDAEYAARVLAKHNGRSRKAGAAS